MCFTNTEGQLTAKVAENDIECYKYLMNAGRGLESPCYDHMWKEKEVSEAAAFSEEGKYEIEAGFHSCKTFSSCCIYRAWMSDSLWAIYKFIIPKGALYFENATQYVSNKIYLASEIPVKETIAA